ncbi:hypothetical protein GE09DRAFT_456927 [Coniochaeta sp. 2T2.1]|nr:hypothetical protein GE09DRAFT_456927 [Coniochaeta sp. 2T2.1]
MHENWATNHDCDPFLLAVSLPDGRGRCSLIKYRITDRIDQGNGLAVREPLMSSQDTGKTSGNWQRATIERGNDATCTSALGKGKSKRQKPASGLSLWRATKRHGEFLVIGDQKRARDQGSRERRRWLEEATKAGDWPHNWSWQGVCSEVTEDRLVVCCLVDENSCKNQTLQQQKGRGAIKCRMQKSPAENRKIRKSRVVVDDGKLG